MTKRTAVVALAVVLFTGAIAAAQSKGLVADVRAAIADKDFARGDKLLAEYKAERGVTSQYLLALSWMGRGSLADKRLDAAERYATETYRLATPLYAKRPLDQDNDLPLAVGASIEVLSQVQAQRGARTEAVSYLQSEMEKHKNTSIITRLQKNLNLLTLEGTTAPALDLSEYLGPAPPTLDQLKGKVVLLFFWAHWCSDCKTQGPVLADLASRYGDQGLVVFAPTQRYGYVARGQDAPPEVEKQYIEKVRQESYSVLAGESIPLSEKNHQRYGVSTTPTLVLLDRDGKVRLYHPGKMTLEALEPMVKKLVAAPSR